MTLSGLLSWLDQRFPAADYEVSTVYRKKRQVREEHAEVEAWLWIEGRTLRYRGSNVEAVYRQLEAEFSSPRIAVSALDWEGVRS